MTVNTRLYLLITTIIIAVGSFAYFLLIDSGSSTAEKFSVYKDETFGFQVSLPPNASVVELATTTADKMWAISFSNPPFSIDVIANAKTDFSSDAADWQNYKAYHFINIGGKNGSLYYHKTRDSSNRYFFEASFGPFEVQSYTTGEALQEKEKLFMEVLTSFSFSQGCHLLQPKDATVIPSPLNLRDGAECNFKISDSLPMYTFIIFADDENTISEFEVMREGKSQQTLHLTGGLKGRDENEPAMIFQAPQLSFNFFRTADVNFDGYQDIRMEYCWGATGNVCSQYFLFNPSSELFEFSEAFTLADGYPDPATKTLSAHWNNGCVGECYHDYFYGVKDGMPVLIKEEEQFLEGEWSDPEIKVIRVTKELKEGKYITSTTTVRTVKTE